MENRYLYVVFLVLWTVLSYSQEVGREEAILAIAGAEGDILEMVEAGFSINSVNDSLFLAKQALERADFAQALRLNATGELAERAKNALEGLRWEGFTYDSVLEHTKNIKLRKQEAYEIFDSIRALEIKVEDYKSQSIDTDEVGGLVLDAKTSFELERYTETKSMISKANDLLEIKKSELTTINIIVESGKSFFEKNWKGLLVGFVVFVVLGLVGFKEYRINKIKKRLKRLKVEEESLISLIKENQIERFKTGTISNSVYRIRAEKYNNRLNEIRQIIPTLITILKREKKGKNTDILVKK